MHDTCQTNASHMSGQRLSYYKRKEQVTMTENIHLLIEESKLITIKLLINLVTGCNKTNVSKMY